MQLVYDLTNLATAIYNILNNVFISNNLAYRLDYDTLFIY